MTKRTFVIVLLLALTTGGIVGVAALGAAEHGDGDGTVTKPAPVKGSAPPTPNPDPSSRLLPEGTQPGIIFDGTVDEVHVTVTLKGGKGTHPLCVVAQLPGVDGTASACAPADAGALSLGVGDPDTGATKMIRITTNPATAQKDGASVQAASGSDLLVSVSPDGSDSAKELMDDVAEERAAEG